MTVRKALTKSEMRAQIKRLNRINADLSDFKTIKQIYDRLFEGVMTSIGTTSSAQQLFRARINPHYKPIHITEITAPPSGAVTGFQRCNAPYKPMFYCSSRRISALRECRVKEGDIAYLSQWAAHDLPINQIFDSQNNDDSYLDMFSEAESIFYTHLDTIFTRRIHETFSADYKFSAAVTERLTSGYPEGKFNVRSDGMAGLRYPSVIDLDGSYNIALPPHFALERTDLLHLMELRVEKVEDDIVSVKLLDTAIDFDDGLIMWSGNPLCIPLLRDKDGNLTMRSNGIRWQLATLEHLVPADTPIDNHLQQLMLE